MTHPTRKKILFLITKSNWGGAQRYVFDLATRIDTTKFEAVVAAGGDGALIEKLEEKGVRVIRIQNLVRDVSVLREVRATIELWKIIRREKPDVLHINSSKAGGLGALLGRFAGVPRIVFTAHGWAFNEGRPEIQRIIIKLLHACTVLLSHETIAVSHALKAQLNLPFVGRKMSVIHNGHDPVPFLEREVARERLATILPSLALYQKDQWSMSIGELHPVKQHDVFIRAMPQILEKYPRTRHIIIGGGDEQARLETLVRDLMLEEHVFFAGHVPEAATLLKAADLFVLPSRSEALAYVVLEACAAELPIVASDVGGIPEIITHEQSGLLVPSGDIDAIAHGAMHILGGELYRRTLAAGAYARMTDFSLERMIRETTALYW